MNSHLRSQCAVATLLILLSAATPFAQPSLNIHAGVQLRWSTLTGHTYRVQWSPSSGASWTDLVPLTPGTGTTNILFDPVGNGGRRYQLLEMVPGSPAPTALPLNGSFELGNEATATNWNMTGSRFPTRTNSAAHTGSFSMRSTLTNTTAASIESKLSQVISAQSGAVAAGRSYDFSFWARQVASGPSYVQQYQFQWRNTNNAVVGGTGLANFQGGVGTWTRIAIPNLVAPPEAVGARILFRFVTGAIAGSHGDVYIDDVELSSEGSPSGPGSTNSWPIVSQPVARVSWPSAVGVEYQPATTTNLGVPSWVDLPSVLGDGSVKTLVLPITLPGQFVRLRSGPPGTDIIALFDSSTPLEAETTIDTPTALITHLGDRARDRHAREAMFHSYDHYLSWYWEERTLALEIIDRVAKGGTGITFNYTTLTPLGAPEFRAFFRGVNTVAEYHFNYSAPLTGPNRYTATVANKLPENRPLQLGDRVEIEVSQFLQAPVHGRNNYYGTALLYVVGQGIVPWHGVGSLLDSHPLPETAWLGGGTTLPYQYSNEPEHRFKQLAGNIAPANAQPFMLGRRLHHTDFGTGAHSEPGNPVYAAQVGKLGPKFIARSCVDCHVNNGRGLPPALGALMNRSVVKVGSDAGGTPHPALGSVLQVQAISGPAEGGATIASYTTNVVEYGDGTSVALRKPNYAFQGVTPAYFSVRLPPPLVGLGLLEAIAEASVLALADADDANADGISGRVHTVHDPETGELRLGRFTTKAGKARLSHQIAGALNTDMGVTTPIAATLDGEGMAEAPELDGAELDRMTRYIALLGVGARRELTNAEALRGEALFTSAHCAKCHTPEFVTSPFYPLTELRRQTIHPYTDLLLHDMGAGLADNMGETGATGAEWRTPPLWNIGFTAGVSGGEAYLHDGRALTLEEAILWHGGEAEGAKEAFRSMPAVDRAALVRFLMSL